MKVWKYQPEGCNAYWEDNPQILMDMIKELEPEEKVEIMCCEMSEEEWDKVPCNFMGF